MRLDSIKYRLLAIICVCLLGMLFLVTTQFLAINQLVAVRNDRELMLRLGNELLQLRRHEKDFMLRHDLVYADQFTARAAEFSLQVELLHEIYRQYGLPAQQLTLFIDSFDLYTARFGNLVQQQVTMGLDENSGQQGEFRIAIHELETRLQQTGQQDLNLLLLQLRRHEKDFLLRGDPLYIQQERQVFLELQQAIGNSTGPESEGLMSLLQRYQSGFDNLVAASLRLGADPDSGIQGELRGAAHAMEDQLLSLDSSLQPLIARQEFQVRSNGLIIAALTAVALLAMLAHSFLGFQRAFNMLITFFYRCKREYQRLDERKLDFAEFKTLAGVVNEMVDARKDMEDRLKEANQRLAEYGNQGH
ncbi:MAG: hypothetical protein RLZZ385_2424 [Pseudomonadota bacterium]|jgi:methyl-accepting chemotaxis protein